jgi:hypothetical protein
MSLATPLAANPVRRSPDDSFKDSLTTLETILGRDSSRVGDAACCDALEAELRRLHARFRAHDAAGYFSSVDPVADIPPQLADEVHRLRSEHRAILGHLDWLVRNASSIADQGEEDQEVFVLRLRELIAILRRHEAEEDRVFFIATWRETGGEGG